MHVHTNDAGKGSALETISIPRQRNTGGLVALTPTGRVEFFHPAAEALFARIEAGHLDPLEADLDDLVITDPLVDLQRFHLTAPAIAFIETTNLCNLRCKHCYARSGLRRKDEMDTARIMRLLDEFGEIGVLQVFLTGGELFAHPDAVEIIRHARTKPFSTQIFTNGLLINEEKLAAIPPGQSFFVSFDTADPERTVRGRMDYPKLRACFEMMKRHGHVFRTAVSVHRNNVNDAEGIFEWCAEHGYPRPQWLETHPIGRALMYPDILLQPDQIDEVFAVYERCMDRFMTAPEEEARAPGGATNAPIRGVDTIKFCQRLERATGQEKCGRSVAYVNSSGTVYPCSNCMSNDVYAAGNVHDVDFATIWDVGFDRFRSITFDGYDVCLSCEVHRADVWCQFRCPPLATNVSGSETGCGATDYLRQFMFRAAAYWARRRAEGRKLVLVAPQ